MDVTPREQPAAEGGSKRRRAPAMILIVVMLAVAGVMLVRTLGSSTMFFYNVDEAVRERTSLGESRFRMQGTVVPDSVERSGDGVTFQVAYGGVAVAVHHVGDPPELFQPGIPVVLEGRWESDSSDAAFSSDRILVKHTNEYDAKNPERIREANDGGATGATASVEP